MEWMMDGKTIHLARDLEAMASFVCSCFGKRMSSANQGEIDGNRPGIASWQPGSVCTSLPFPPTEPTVPWRGQYLLWLLDGLDIWYFTDSKCSGMHWSHQSEGFFFVVLSWCFVPDFFGVMWSYLLFLFETTARARQPYPTPEDKKKQRGAAKGDNKWQQQVLWVERALLERKCGTSSPRPRGNQWRVAAEVLRLHEKARLWEEDPWQWSWMFCNVM